jgi:3-isopropylmalate/(R)-2-methylmalate dehydratase small subunit
MTLSGRVWKYGDHVDTDAIIPARYLATSDPSELSLHCMEDVDPHFVRDVRPGDILVAGENFGCGSSREHAPLAIGGAGIACVIAASYARIFHRNALNVALPILVCPAAAREAEAGHMLEVDLESGKITNRSLGSTYEAAPYPSFMLDLIRAGGLVPFTRGRLAAGVYDQLRERT